MIVTIACPTHRELKPEHYKVCIKMVTLNWILKDTNNFFNKPVKVTTERIS